MCLRRRQGTPPAPLATPKAKGYERQYPRDANIARNPAARGQRAPRDSPLLRHSSMNVEGSLRNLTDSYIRVVAFLGFSVCRWP